MINVSNDFKEKMKENRNFKSYAEVTFPDGNVITLDSSQFTVTRNSLTDGADNSDFPLGVAVCKQVQLEILNNEEQYKNYSFTEAKIRLYVDFELNENRTERIEKGTYTVISPETYGETVIINAYDDMYKTDRDYTTSLTFPQTAGAVLRDICSTCDLFVGSTSFLHDDFIIQEKPVGKFREIIGYIAMIACGNARIDRNNRLQIMTYDLDWGYAVNIGKNLLRYTKEVTGHISYVYGRSSNTYLVDNEGFTVTTIAANNSYNFLSYFFTDIPISEIEDKQVTISAWIKSDGLKTFPQGFHIVVGAFTSSNTRRRYRVLGQFNNDAYYNVSDFRDGEWVKLVCKSVLPAASSMLVENAAEDYIKYGIQFFVNNNNGQYPLQIKKVKCEFGNIDDPIYTRAPEDSGKPYYFLSEWQSPKIEYNDTVITGFSTVIKGETSEDDTEIRVGTDTYLISVTNPLMAGKEETVLSWLYECIGNVPFRPFSGDMVSNPMIEFMDLCKVKDRRGNLYNSFVTDVNFVFLGTTTVSNQTPGMARSAMTYSSDAAKVETYTRKLVEKEKTDREMAVGQLNQKLNNSSGMYSTDVPQPDGSAIRYLHDKPALSESQNVIKITSDAIGFSTDGGKTYPYGQTLNGETITRLLYAEGINADYLDTGAITVRDSSGNIIFSVDMDTKQVIISGDSVRIGGKSATQAISDNLAEAKNYSDGKLSDYANTVTANITNLQSQIDGAIETFFYDYEPTLQNIPASQWTTTAEREKHEGDLFYWKSKGYAYHFFKDGATWKWQLVQDTDITQAMAAAEKAQDTADGKRRVFVVTPQPPYDIGDLWTNGTDILTCAVARAQGSAYVSSDWKKLNKYTDDTKANEALEEAKKSRNLNIILDNEYQGIPSDYQGNIAVFPEVKTFVQVLYGHTDVSVNCTYSISKSSGITGTWDNAKRTYTVTGLTTDTGWVDITASYLNLFTTTKRFNLAKIKDGSPGEKGAKGDTGPQGPQGTDGRVYGLEYSANVIKQGKDGELTPAYIDFDAYYRNGTSATRTAYAGRFKIEESTDGNTWTTVYTSAANESSVRYSLYTFLTDDSGNALMNDDGYGIAATRDFAMVKCTLYAAGGTTTMLDTQTIVKVIDAEALTHEEIFNLLTNNGAVKGIYMENGQLYISFSYAKGGELTLGGADNAYGKLKILDESGKQIGNWDKDGLEFSKTIGSWIFNSLIGSVTTWYYQNEINRGGFMVASDFSGNADGRSEIILSPAPRLNSSSYTDKAYNILSSNRDFLIESKKGSSDLWSAIRLGDNGNASGDVYLIAGNNNTAIYAVGVERLASGGVTVRLYSSEDGTIDLTSAKYIRLNGKTVVQSVYFDTNLTAPYMQKHSSAVRINGNFEVVNGSKSKVAVTEDYGERLLYCYEMPSPMFGDTGEAEIDENGECYIYLDDVFSETVTANIEYQVFLQKEGPGDLWIAEKNPVYFIVKGTENLKFAWEIKAKQRGYECERLENTEPENEPEETDYEEEYMKEISRLMAEQEEIYYETVKQLHGD